MGVFWAVVTALAAGLLYLFVCRIWPFGPCFRCHGDGKHRQPGSKAFRRCRRCKGSGMRLRWGTRLINGTRDTARQIK